MADTFLDLISKENWELISKVDPATGEKSKRIYAYGQEFPVVHPFSIHGKMYRISKNPDEKYFHFKAMHDYAWPETKWHYWTERRFRAHCEGWKCISLASGGHTGKSYDAAKIGLLFWLAYQKGRAVIIASTTLASLDGRIWGYLLQRVKDAQIPIQYLYKRSKPPAFLYDNNDTLHGVFAIAAKKGDDDTAIANWIGRHPTDGLMLILDEGPDMPIAILNALPNLEKGQEGQFQIMVIGNSNSKYDLHGSLSTPKNGWESINRLTDTRWETTQDKGICLYFNCYESPAIYEADPIKKADLSKILFTKDKIDHDIAKYGADSIQFYRFTLGFWKDDGTESTVLSQTFLKNFSHEKNTEWSPYEQLKIVAGLDPAFSYGGDNCILQLAILGLDMNGQVILDFKGVQLLFYIKTLANVDKSIELQIADQVIEKLNEFRVPLKDLAIDCSGQGRALAEVLRLRANVIEYPIKLYSIQSYSIAKIKRVKQQHDIQLISNYEMWHEVRRYIEGNSLRGINRTAINQFITRLVAEDKGRIMLETKADYKKRMGAISPTLAVSPDEADGVSLTLQVAIRNYGFFPGQIVGKHATDEYKVPHLSRGAQTLDNRVEQVHMPEFGSGYLGEKHTGIQIPGMPEGKVSKSIFGFET